MGTAERAPSGGRIRRKPAVPAAGHPERDYRTSEAKYRALVEQIPAVTYVEAIEGLSNMTYVSPQVQDMLGYSPTDWTKDPDLWVKLVHEDDRERVMALNEACIAGEGLFRAEYRLVAKDGRTVWVRDGAVLVKDDQGQPLFWQGVMFDITEWKRAEQTLHDALEKEREATNLLRDVDRMRNTAMHALAHDLRTSLADVKAAADVLDRELELAPEDRRWLARGIGRQAMKIDLLLLDLLDLDRLERGILEAKREPTNMADLIRRTVQEQTALQGRHVEIDATPVTVLVEAAKVERILENLLTNAATHTPEGTPIWVRIRSQEGGIVLVVEDAGPGVPADEWASVFLPFIRGARSERAPGSGIGLSLVAGFAELHGGRAWVEDRPGGGASFQVFLPDPIKPGIANSRLARQSDRKEGM
jgi:PAS domain S-box-containing protein